MEAELTQAEARVGEILATIDRKTIRAPFSGVLGIRQVNLGQYLNGGDAVGGALIVRAAINGGCEVLYSEDLQHGFRIEGLEIVNPLEDAS